MPRDLPLGNGDLLVTFDSRYQLRDIYYPQVGQENHTGGEPCRFGLWVDGAFAWTDDSGWERDLRFAHETLVSEVTLGHARLGVRVRCRDTVDFDRNLYLKEVTVEDVTGKDRDVRLFQHFDAHLWGNDIGDSAFYDPRTRAIVHYKGRRYFLLTGVNAKGESGLSSFAIGLKEALGREGTWRDAEDGELSRNLVAQGSIDSVGMLGVRVGANALATATFVIAAGQTYDEVRDLDKLVRERGVGSLMSRDGYLLHKYNPDGSVGSSWHAWSTTDGRLELPIQEDETGLPIWALWQHYDRDRDIEFVRPLYRKLVRTGADFMSSYREPRTKLPAPSFDLWEERRGIHAFTTAAVWAGLSAARDFAAAFGQHDLSKRYGTAADEIKTAALTHLYDDERGRFVRTVTVLADGTITKDATLDLSMAGIFLFGMLPADDPRVVATMRALESRLWVRTAIGGFARYENDSYFQQSEDIANVPGNPWFVATLWVVEHHIATAKTLADLERPRELLEWCATKANRSGVLAEQVHPLTGDPMSVAPLTWSHAAYG